jgi:hypothetical protein
MSGDDDGDEKKKVLGETCGAESAQCVANFDQL